MDRQSHIIVVDDEDLVAFALSLALQDEGFRVTVCHDGREALIAEREDGSDVLLTDLRMPGMGGLELIREVRQRRPHARIIVMTGYSEGYPTEEVGRLTVLRKPFPMHTLVTTVRGMLDG
ncbi:response regulator [Azospirillum endophyticum]